MDEKNKIFDFGAPTEASKECLLEAKRYKNIYPPRLFKRSSGEAWQKLGGRKWLGLEHMLARVYTRVKGIGLEITNEAYSTMDEATGVIAKVDNIRIPRWGEPTNKRLW